MVQRGKRRNVIAKDHGSRLYRQRRVEARQHSYYEDEDDALQEYYEGARPSRSDDVPSGDIDD